MNFLFWHYSQGLALYLRRWVFAMGWMIHYFSLPLLPLSLFSPWKRLIDTQEVVGFNLEKLFEQFTYNLISRVIGAIVRTFLFIIGLLALLPVVVIGFIGVFFWICVPLVGIPDYYFRQTRGPKFLLHIIKRILAHPQSAVTNLFDNSAGKFVLSHTQLDISSLQPSQPLSAAQFSELHPASISSYADLIGYFTQHHIWDENHLRRLGVSFADLHSAATWWDSQHQANFDRPDSSLHYSRPGIGLELLFGYTPQLNQYSVDLSSPTEFSHHLIGREKIVSRMERTLNSGQSLILVGQPGVGKKTVLLEFAKRSREGELGPQLVYKRVLEFDYHFLLSKSKDLNSKKAQFSALMSEATAAGNVILVIKDLHRLTNSSVEGVDLTDVFEKALEKKDLKVIAVSSQADYERFLYPNIRLRKFFTSIEIEPATKAQAFTILTEAADSLEKRRHLALPVQALKALLDASDRYITETPFPEKAIELLDHLEAFIDKERLSEVTIDTVNQVVSEITGISLSRLTQREKHVLANLEDVLHETLINQNSAVSAIAQSLRAASVGVKNPNRPLGSFLFLGPTGVGKTQTAKSLAEVYYGSSATILRFDMAEYSGTEGIARLIGSASQKTPGALTSAIKNHPASLLLLDEIEKATPEIFNLFLTLLDEGYLRDAQDHQINCQHLFVIATSNAGSEFIRQAVTRDHRPANLQSQVIDHIQSQHLFSPEFLNRFDGVVVFEPLSAAHLIDVARLQLQDLAGRLKEKNIHLQVTPALCEKVAADGYQPEFGARPMRRIVDITLGDLLGKAILAETLVSGDVVEIIPQSDPNSYTLSVARS